MSEPLNILVIGDIIGRAGRRALGEHLPTLIDMHRIDFVVANGENLAHGFGLNESVASEMFKIGVNVLTNGNHCWDQRDFLDLIDEDDRFVRPMNFTEYAPGRGWTVQETGMGHKIAVINLIGQTFMGPWDCPFAAVDRAMDEIPDDVSAVLVDMHAEATSEKMGMGWYMDGRASFVYGTHTHIPTCDEIIHASGTAYQSDIGMTGSYQSIIGMKVEGALTRMVQRLPQRFEAVEKGGSVFATMVSIDPITRMALSIERIHIPPH
ncbi:MAG: metallophosphoesterase [Zetaproteobacteria bacterium CG12_big_fil_rev_8_21_14_0_65_54_13]|nr:MAG: metallophosphoesterase [Zetaproteobacteria bacterium CG23_combo_of_CG06-09_8_20_14_all_54_7]PIW50797.1 MAG: metallophosphoesterase [Zetaproteobacteria bacterium CG12_big_fil_rev_8_21_14_0_65_54_13]PIX55294.1 MAG: metallophosphoesterase [Zetaproteobacteria bacterium CG_4_10_14_3_um_filter_54_28]PJA26868.1 MAG: metallophosphoesterase [Zetaproteobacteria bacterium CG_4_9_14_3_um_filter_54_145]